MRKGLLVRAAAVCLVMVLTVTVVGCESDSAAIWTSEAKSPSGRWTSKATTIQTSGLGAASVGTSVQLSWIGLTSSPTLILGLENETAYPIGITAVKMTWIESPRVP